MTARPIGYFVHHQGRGHAERAAHIANALAGVRPVTLFCARDDIFPPLAAEVDLIAIPSLFEPSGQEPTRLEHADHPDTLHCAPLGWRSIRKAIATIAAWFEQADAALFVTDVSAELGQFARIASVPHVAVLQHGDRADPGHIAAYRAAVGLLAPYAEALEQPERPGWMRAKTFYAPGVGVPRPDFPDRDAARRKLDLPSDREIVLAIAGGGGTGTPTAPLTLGARDEPESLWVTIGEIASQWHETPPANLRHAGWVENPADWIAAADRIVSSCGNTTVHLVGATDKPWVVVPEWRYFDEQLCKARTLDRAGMAAASEHWPSHTAAWRNIWQRACALDPATRRVMISEDAAHRAAGWLDEMATNIWAGSERLAVPARVEPAGVDQAGVAA